MDNKEDNTSKTAFKAQKDEFELTLKARDDEVTAFVENLIKENTSLKKQIVMLEIEVEHFKEKLQNLRAIYYDLNSGDGNDIDKVFFNNIKQIKESHEHKRKEITEKYDKLYSSLTRDHCQMIFNIKRIAGETYNKNSEIEIDINSNVNYNHSLASIENIVGMKERIESFDHKIKVLQEELFNREKYALVLQQKYETMVEENKLLKVKLQEEKKQIFETIDDISSQYSQRKESYLKRITDDLCDIKNEYRNSLKVPLKKSEMIVKELCQEKERLLDEVKGLTEIIEKLKSDNVLMFQEKEAMKTTLCRKEKEYEYSEKNKQNYEKQTKSLQNEKEQFKQSQQDLIKTTNELRSTIALLEAKIKFISESSSDEISKLSMKSKETVDSLYLRIADMEKKLRESLSTIDENHESLIRKDQKVNELNDTIEYQLKQINSMKQEINEKDLTLKLQNEMILELKKINVKLTADESSLNEVLSEIEEEHSACLHKLTQNEIEIKALKDEIVRVEKIRDELSKDLDEATRTNILSHHQLETLKITSNIDNQRLKNKLNEYEKNFDKTKGMISTEQENYEKAEIKKEIKDLKIAIGKLYKVYKEKAAFETKITQFEEMKMLTEMEMGIDKVISSIVAKEIKTSNDKMAQFEEEIKSYKKKMNTVIQIANSAKGPKDFTANVPNSVEPFKAGENKGSSISIQLQENLIIYLKNINLKHLLEIFQLNLQREEEIFSLINDKDKSTSIVAHVRMQLSELNSNFENLKKTSERTFNEYETRAKNYIPLEEFEARVEETRGFTQTILDMFLNELQKYKVEIPNNVSIIMFQLPISEYNQLIENISIYLDNMNHKINSVLEAYNRQAGMIEKAIDVIFKQTYVDYDILNNLLKEKII